MTSTLSSSLLQVQLPQAAASASTSPSTSAHCHHDDSDSISDQDNTDDYIATAQDALASATTLTKHSLAYVASAAPAAGAQPVSLSPLTLAASDLAVAAHEESLPLHAAAAPSVAVANDALLDAEPHAEDADAPRVALSLPADFALPASLGDLVSPLSLFDKTAAGRLMTADEDLDYYYSPLNDFLARIKELLAIENDVSICFERLNGLTIHEDTHLGQENTLERFQALQDVIDLTSEQQVGAEEAEETAEILPSHPLCIQLIVHAHSTKAILGQLLAQAQQAADSSSEPSNPDDEEAADFEEDWDMEDDQQPDEALVQGEEDVLSAVEGDGNDEDKYAAAAATAASNIGSELSLSAAVDAELDEAGDKRVCL
ncbi:hypothetical protein RI367_007377 [Sorochytrium milnesiophthora]